MDVVKEDNGAKLHITQVLRDRTSIMVLADFTAPEGTSLKMGDPDSEKVFIGSDGFYGGGEHYFMDEAGEKIDLGIYRNYIYQWEILTATRQITICPLCLSSSCPRAICYAERQSP